MNPATPPSRQGTAPTAAPRPRRAAPATADDAAPAPTGAWQASMGAASNADLKLAMAASGTALSVFTVGHMAGNMQVYLGRERYNRYALLLRHAGAPVLPANTLLWAARIGLLASAATHVAAGTELTLRAWRAEGRTAGDVARQGARNTAQLLRRGAVARLLPEDAARSAVETAPPTTRARVRADFVSRARERGLDYAVDWTTLKLTDHPLHAIVTKDPFDTSSAAVDRLFGRIA